MNETFGERFLRLRKAKGLTQDDIASKVNISYQAVSKWENDITSPDINMIIELSEILGVSTDELLGVKKEVSTLLVTSDKKDINKLLLKIIIESSDGDKIKINLPMSLIKLALDTGIDLPQVSNNNSLKDINFSEIFNLVEKGVLGRLLEIESKEGDFIYISVE